MDRYTMLDIAIVEGVRTPFVKAFGNPITLAGVNTLGLQRAGFDAASIAQTSAWYEQRTPIEAPLLAAYVRAYEERRAQTHRPALEIGSRRLSG